MTFDPLRLTKMLYDWYKGTGGQPPVQASRPCPLAGDLNKVLGMLRDDGWDAGHEVEGSCPLDHTPNAETIEAIRAADRGEVNRHASPREMFEAMGIDDTPAKGDKS